MPLETTQLAVIPIELKEPTERCINSSQRLRVLELLLVISAAFALLIVSSARRISADVPVRPYTNLGFVEMTVWELIAISILGYVVFRQGRTWSDFTEKLGAKDVVRAIAVFAIAIALSRFSYYFVQYVHVFWTGTWLHPKSLKGLLAVGVTVPSVVFMLVNPFFEELIARAYVMTEIGELTKSRTLAVIASCALQTSYHLYQGWLRAATVGATFLVFSIYYARTRRIAPVIAAHMFIDFVALAYYR